MCICSAYAVVLLVIFAPPPKETVIFILNWEGFLHIGINLKSIQQSKMSFSCSNTQIKAAPKYTLNKFSRLRLAKS